jgi:hypothetical protein
MLGSFLNDLRESRVTTVESQGCQLKTLGLGGWQLHGQMEPLHSDILVPNHFQEYCKAIMNHLED